MAKHQRQMIREAAHARLLNRTEAEDRVFKSKFTPYRGLTLPAISVYTLDEDVDPASKNTAPRELSRDVQLTIECTVIANSDADDKLDALALEVERAMHADPTLGGAASDTVLLTTRNGQDEKGERPIAFSALIYTARYYTHAPEAEDVTLDRFVNAEITTRLGGVADPVVDRVQVEAPT